MVDVKNEDRLGVLAVHTLVLMGIMLVTGFLTRMLVMLMMGSPIIQFFDYGMHALLAAPLFALIITFYIARHGHVLPPAIAMVACGCILCVMSPAMGLSLVFPPLLMTVVYLFVRKPSPDVRSMVAGTTAGALFYPSTIVVGLVAGSYAFTAADGQGMQCLLMVLIGCALSFLGALLGSLIAERRSKCTSSAAKTDIDTPAKAGR